MQIEEVDAEMAAGSQKVQKFLVLDFAKGGVYGRGFVVWSRI